MVELRHDKHYDVPGQVWQHTHASLSFHDIPLEEEMEEKKMKKMKKEKRKAKEIEEKEGDALVENEVIEVEQVQEEKERKEKKESKENKKRNAKEIEKKEGEKEKKEKKEYLGYDLSSNKGSNHLKNKIALDASRTVPGEKDRFIEALTTTVSHKGKRKSICSKVTAEMHWGCACQLLISGKVFFGLMCSSFFSTENVLNLPLEPNVLNLPAFCLLRFMGWLDQQGLGPYAGEDGWAVAGVMTKPLLKKVLPCLARDQQDNQGRAFLSNSSDQSFLVQAFLSKAKPKKGEKKRTLERRRKDLLEYVRALGKTMEGDLIEGDPDDELQELITAEGIAAGALDGISHFQPDLLPMNFSNLTLDLCCGL